MNSSSSDGGCAVNECTPRADTAGSTRPISELSTSNVTRMPASLVVVARSCTPAMAAIGDGSPSTTAVTDERVRWRRSSSVPDSTARPPRMIVTVSQTFSTSLRMWLDSSTEVPAALASRTCSVNTASMRGSRPDVGSSSTSRSTWETNAATSATFCRLPLE